MCATMNTVVDHCIPDEAVCDLLLMRPDALIGICSAFMQHFSIFSDYSKHFTAQASMHAFIHILTPVAPGEGHTPCLLIENVSINRSLTFALETWFFCFMSFVVPWVRVCVHCLTIRWKTQIMS